MSFADAVSCLCGRCHVALRHPWVLKLDGDSNWPATVTADRLEVTDDGALVLFDGNVVALVIQPRHYSYVKLLDWTGIIGDE